MVKEKPIINVIGAGHLGKTIAKLISIHAAGTIQGIVNTSLSRSQAAVQFIGQGNAYASIAELPPADLTLITTPDDKIQACCEQLAVVPQLTVGSIVAHCSGSLSSQVLISVKQRNCGIASVHPMNSFSDPANNVMQYAGTYCAVEGEPVASELLCTLFQKIGSVTYVLDSRKKGLYHVAGVLASNYCVTLCEEAIHCLMEAGVDHDMALKIVQHLMQATSAHLIQTTSPSTALTGPIHRGDVNVIQEHLKVITDDERATVYKILGLMTLKMTSLPAEIADRIRALLLT